MLHVNLIAVGRLKEKFWVDACDEYQKRLGRYLKCDIAQVPDCDPATNGGQQAARERETASITRRLNPDSYVILLDRQGEQLSSEQLADFINKLQNAGHSDLTLIVGGSTGVARELLPRVNKTISFGKITLPHNLAHVVCLEQLYRACKIIANEPYHK